MQRSGIEPLAEGDAFPRTLVRTNRCEVPHSRGSSRLVNVGVHVFTLRAGGLRLSARVKSIAGVGVVLVIRQRRRGFEARRPIVPCKVRARFGLNVRGREKQNRTARGLLVTA